MTPASPSARLQTDENPVAMQSGDDRQLATEGLNHD
jgi:hypothetical protein